MPFDSEFLAVKVKYFHKLETKYKKKTAKMNKKHFHVFYIINMT